MRPLRALALGLIVSGCSDNRSDAPEPAKPEGAVALILQSIGELPKLEMRLGFAPTIDPGPHIEPLAGAMVEARKVCFGRSQTPATPAGLVAALHVVIRNGMLTAKATNAQGQCLAKQLDGRTVTDKVDASFALTVSVAAK